MPVGEIAMADRSINIDRSSYDDICNRHMAVRPPAREFPDVTFYDFSKVRDGFPTRPVPVTINWRVR